jgi:hypothetical protein
MKGLWSTIALALVAIGLGAYIYFADPQKAPDTPARDKVFSVAADKVRTLTVAADGETSVLEKKGDSWQMTAPVATDADQTEVTSLVTNLSTLEINRVVDENAADLAQYGLAEPKITVEFGGEGTSGKIAFGDKTPTSGDMYAVKPGEKKVFLVSAFLESTFNRKPFDLRDKRVVRFERDKADGLEVTTAAGTAVMARSGSDWTVTAPVQTRADYGAIEGLLTRVSTAVMSGIAETAPADLKKYGLDAPQATIVVKSGSSTATLTVGKEEDGKVYAKDAARDMVFTVDASFANDVRRTPDDFRDKDLFEFRGFTASKLVITRGADTVTLEKAGDKWTRASAATQPDAAKLEDFLAQLSALKAAAWIPAAQASGLNAPAVRVEATYDEKKLTESVSFARAGNDVFAARAGEPGAARVEAAAFDGALKALDEALAPPPPATPAAAPPAGDAAKKP